MRRILSANLRTLCCAALIPLGLSPLACDSAAEPSAEPTSADAKPEARPVPSPPDPEFIRTHVIALSDDAMEGRRPGTPGAKKAVAYLIEQMKALGLEPAGENGSYTQTVPMRSVQTDREKSTLTTFKGKKGKKKVAAWKFGTDWVGTTFAAGSDHPIDAELVFLGYGVTAPEYKWDDYEGVDMKGKIAVVFVGDPPVTDGRFAGKAMTYYGRWSYKYERALAAGALGCLVIHQTEAASYGWNVPTSSYSGERFHVVAADGEVPPALSLQGWISDARAQELAKAMGGELSAWYENALKPDFKAVSAGIRLRGKMVTSDRRTEDVNVLAKIPGGAKADQAVLVTAHWDHLGVASDAAEGEDAIYNGAVDNASGTAGLLSLGKQLMAQIEAGEELGRSVVLLATTAEEQGLLGSRYYAANPLVPLANIAGVLNMDSINVYRPTSAVEVIGAGQSTLEDLLGGVIEEQGRTVRAESHPESGGFYRSDHFPFAKVGVPALYFHAALDTMEGDDPGPTIETRRANYHTVRDEYDPAWSFEGASQLIATVAAVATRIANAEQMPSWKPESEFASVKR